MEPRFKKEMEGEDKPPKDPLKEWKEKIAEKKIKYLRLGYTKIPRKQKVRVIECPAGKENCKDCKGTNIIPPETLLRKEPAEEKQSQDPCGECTGVDCPAQGVSCAGKE